mmetsp:Transcript_9964/g.18202  ORF Transcript_9964/g.18202 Transcript_9964/m.18202 type:complete len:202 (+) Transcript_9964:1618-2223(+)
MNIYSGHLAHSQNSQSIFAFSGVRLVWFASSLVTSTGSTNRCKGNLLQFGLVVVSLATRKDHQGVSREYFHDGSHELGCSSKCWGCIILKHTNVATLGRILSNAQRRNITRGHHADCPIRNPSKAILKEFGSDISTRMMHRSDKTNSRFICAIECYLKLSLQQTQLRKFTRGIGKRFTGCRWVQPGVAHSGTRNTSQNKGK